MIFAVVVFSAVIWSSTSFWLVIARATVTAVRSAPTVVVDARSTPYQLDIVLLDQTQRRDVAVHSPEGMD